MDDILAFYRTDAATSIEGECEKSINVEPEERDSILYKEQAESEKL